MVEKECNVCGQGFFASGIYSCPTRKCTGTMCTVITPLPGKRVSGVLCRDKKHVKDLKEICLACNQPLVQLKLGVEGTWGLTTGHAEHSWTIREWKEQYGKLPRKGSK